MLGGGIKYVEFFVFRTFLKQAKDYGRFIIFCVVGFALWESPEAA